VWKTFYEYYERYGPVDSALFYLKIANSVNDSVQGIEVQKNLDKLEVKFETHLKEKENQLLRTEVLAKNVQVKQKEGERRFWQILMFCLFLLLVLVIVIGTSILKIRRQKLEVKEKKLVHFEQIKKLLLRKLDDADQAVQNAEQAISELKDKQTSSPESKHRPELLIESMRNEKDWVAFMVEFELIYTRFFTELNKVSSSDFTNGERRLLALIKLGLTNQEIADHIFISIDSVKKSKNRLFKKINLSDSKLRPTDFIRNLE
jgi:DNA-binding CsgD family transcriptional regulator